MTGLREQALTAARHAIRDGQWWLPPAGQEQLVDAVLAVIQQRADLIRADADHHDGCLREPNADGGISHSSIAAGLRIALRHLDADISEPRTEPEPQKELVVRKIAILRQLCPTGQHVEHPGYTCDEADWWATRWAEVIDNAGRAFDALAAREAAIPAALRGPNWKAKP
ncbi:hypothetical protein [Streptomyces virginiae]|uniref:hypothetical protein n=1 Tax=Streptomyces virginiae TaxID=1961 RepID=UPI0034197116